MKNIFFVSIYLRANLFVSIKYLIEKAGMDYTMPLLIGFVEEHDLFHAHIYLMASLKIDDIGDAE